MKLLSTLALALVLTSCVSHEELLNFSQGSELNQLPTAIANAPTLKIQYDDLLSIRVSALDVEAVVPFNVDPPNSANIQGGAGFRPLIGYLVNSQGTIDFPVLGEISVAGLTMYELKAQLRTRLLPYLKDPVIDVRFLNFRITVLGEVRNPNTFLVANERITVLDALGQAGDLTPYGSRTNVLVIREQNGQRTFGRLNLQDRHLFESPHFYLQQNDVVYVEPIEEITGTLRDQSQRILPWLSVITSLTTLVISLTR